MPRIKKTKKFLLEAGFMWGRHYAEPFIGNEPVPAQDLEMWKRNEATGHISEHCRIVEIILN